ncbi:MAG TPA: hypothetical protein VI432_02780, partial [Candidatus Paceibacterota bacterium]
ILPPVYFSSEAMLLNPDWIGSEALYRHPAVQAALEATEYWAWFIGKNAPEFPHLANLSWETKVLGYDAGYAEFMDADIIIDIAMVSDPHAGSQHAGLASGNYNHVSGKQYCLATNAGIGAMQESDQPTDLRNIVLHEFGHCIGAGHTGSFPPNEQCSPTYGCFDNQPEDVMTGNSHYKRNCLSNINLFSLAEIHDSLPPIQNAGWYDGEAFVLKEDYGQTCMPEAMNRF